MADKRQDQKINGLQEILEILGEVSRPAVEEKLSTFQSWEDFTTTLSMNDVETKDIDLTIYCNKTGQPIDEVSKSRFTRLLKMYGREKTIDILKRNQLNRVAEHWLYTDGKSLEKLSEVDPRGYFVYATSLLFLPVQGWIGIKLNQWEEDYEKRLAWHKKKVSLWRNIAEVSPELLIEVNEMLRRFLGVFHLSKCLKKNLVWHETNIPFVSPSLLLEDLKKNIKTLLEYEAKRGRIKHNPSLAEINDLKIIYVGYSQFRQQKRLAKMSELERLMLDLAEFFPADPESIKERETKSHIHGRRAERMLLEQKVKQRPYIPLDHSFALNLSGELAKPKNTSLASLADRLRSKQK